VTANHRIACENKSHLHRLFFCIFFVRLGFLLLLRHRFRPGRAAAFNSGISGVGSDSHDSLQSGPAPESVSVDII